MAENQEGATAVEEQTFEYPIKIEDSGPATKRVSIEIPQDRISQKLEEQFKELRKQAAIPGFRPGHAPKKLIEKKFSNDVKEQVRRDLISESYKQAVEKNKLEVIGEPNFQNPEGIQLPESGSLTYSFEVEVQPQITLPELKGIKIKKPKIQVTDENVNQALQNLVEQQGTLVPVEDRGVQEKDYLIADLAVKVEGNVVGHQHDAQVIVRPGRIGGIMIDDLVDELKGAKPGDRREIQRHVPEDHANPAIRGQNVAIEVKLKDIKRLEEAELDEEFLDSLGFTNKQELMNALREEMENRIHMDVQHAMREQVKKFLMENTQVELPERLSDKQTDRVVSRRAVDLMMRGVPREQVEANVERLRGGAREEALRELKLFFILQKIANEAGVDVDEAELNGQIAMMAAQSGKRPEKLKHEMAQDATLSNMYVQMRESKALDQILTDAQFEEVDVKPPAQEEKKQEKEDETKQ